MPADTVTGKTVILITGAKSGIGKGLLTSYALRHNTIVIAAIRDGPHSVPGEALRSLPLGSGSKLIVAKYDASDPKSAVDMAHHLQSRHDIVKVDTVIASAGILNHYGFTRDAKVEDLTDHFKINTLAPILLYQAFRHLLQRAEEPKLVIISSTLGSNALQDEWNFPFLAYGMSKAAVNFAAGRMHREEDKIAVVSVHPGECFAAAHDMPFSDVLSTGWVHTAMGEQAARYIDFDPNEIPTSIDESVSDLMQFFDQVTKKEHRGGFHDQKGHSIPW